MVEFAEKNGMTLEWRDFFHVHVITDVGPPSDTQASEEFIVEHYLGCLGHGREYNGTRSKVGEADNFNIFLPGCEEVAFFGATADREGGEGLGADPFTRVPDGTIDPVRSHETALGGLSPASIYFRYCEADEPERRGVYRVEKGDRILCFGLRRFWDDSDPALGNPPRAD